MASKVWCVRSCVQDRDIDGVRTPGLHQFVLRGRFGARWALEQKKKKSALLMNLSRQSLNSSVGLPDL